ncbi:MAG: hypothetical protein ACRDRA_11400 [Pseudonocardiaceae bacterium]
MHGTRNEVVPSPPPFEIVLRGFDRKQVVDHVNALKARVGALGAERDAALRRIADLEDTLDQLRREAEETTRQVDRLRREAKAAATEVDRLQRSPVAGASARIQRMLQMAEDEAAELQTSVEQETSSLRESARAEADQLLSETRQLCARLEAESTRRREAAEAESAGRRYLAEQQSEQDIAGRQAEMEAWASDYQTRSIAAVHALVQIAGERLNSRVVKVNRQVDAAKALRSEVTGQLTALQRLLAEALGEVDQPVPAEQAEQAVQAEQLEHAEPAERVSEEPTAQPVVGAGRSRGRPGPTRQLERPGQAGWPQRADQPTARFGLHPY